ncbi:mechanosensitive ion channel family protein (plasmid) [Paracoccus denitrificans]|uniref:mechanosensitive ion channel family protein n=1 Tax=Paracoccus denitrificans TaxID=266 RepID=UPI001E38C1A0|nr:mechanosensitive ion channel family protein [Paracoccus denitrificans]UFS68355.1 mechanosensitive ion channel family protein [Paracoccus denitrificans]
MARDEIPATGTLWRLAAIIGMALAVATLAEPLARRYPDLSALQLWAGPLRDAGFSVACFAGAHLAHGLAARRLLRRRKGRRAVPKVLLDLLRFVLFAVAALASLSLFFRQDLSGILTGSGLVLAVLGFAIRNAVADVFSGLAMGIEAPFRIGDWVRIETLAEGRVQEIGWRTTRLVTRDSTYVILPNSQISARRITNFSAPRQEYRDHAELTLPADLPVAEAGRLIAEAAGAARTISVGKPPEVQVTDYGPAGIAYRVKYWVPQHDRELACRNEVLSLIDAALREQGIRLTAGRMPCGDGQDSASAGRASGEARRPIRPASAEAR